MYLSYKSLRKRMLNFICIMYICIFFTHLEELWKIKCIKMSNLNPFNKKIWSFYGKSLISIYLFLIFIFLQCPFYDSETTIEKSGFYQTLMKQSGISIRVSISSFLSFYSKLIVRMYCIIVALIYRTQKKNENKYSRFCCVSIKSI